MEVHHICVRVIIEVYAFEDAPVSSLFTRFSTSRELKCYIVRAFKPLKQPPIHHREDGFLLSRYLMSLLVLCLKSTSMLFPDGETVSGDASRGEDASLTG